MTTTAFDDQFTAEPEHVTHRPYDTAAILRQNVADLERELKRQRDRADKAESAIASAREDLQSFIDSRDTWMARAHASEAELKAAREQEPVTYVHDPNGYAIGGTHIEIADALPVGTDLYTRPIPAPAPAVPEVLPCWLIEKSATTEWPAAWLTLKTFGLAYVTSGNHHYTSTAACALKFADKESADEYVRHDKIKDVVVTEHIFDKRALLQSGGGE